MRTTSFFNIVQCSAKWLLNKIRIRLIYFKNVVTVPTIKMAYPAERARKAELVWSLKCVASNFSASSCDGIPNVFKAMGLDIPNDFSLGRTKHLFASVCFGSVLP